MIIVVLLYEIGSWGVEGIYSSIKQVGIGKGVLTVFSTVSISIHGYISFLFTEVM